MTGSDAAVAAWIIGEGGLLGAAVRRALPDCVPGARIFDTQALDLPWHDTAACERALDLAARRFFTDARRGPWVVLWCAGAGVVGVSEEALALETALFSALLHSIATHRGPAVPGAIFFASSAGGVYAGSTAVACDEETQCRPISPYGRAKLEQEELLARWSAGQADVSTLVARISNLYGPGQNLNKPQGLISQLCRSLLLGRAAHVYVPLDTRRDYLYADDCATTVALGIARLRRESAHTGGPVHVRKVLASESETSIAALLAILRRIARRPVRVVVAPTPAARLQPHALRLRSHVWTDLRPGPGTALPVGIHRVWQHQLQLLRRGRLPAAQPAAVSR